MRKEINSSEEFLETLEGVRHKEERSYRDVTQRVGLAHASYWNWATGASRPKLDTALKYAKALGFKVFLER